MLDPGLLRLSALDEDDLHVVSSLLQDCIIKAGDWLYDPKTRSFIFLGLRFCHEKGPKPHRAATALRMDGVLAVRSKGLQTHSGSEQILSLLSLSFIKHPESHCAPEGEIVIKFAGNGEIVIRVECIDVLLVDRSVPRPARSKPKHET
jgi:hypothetical protein